MGKVEYYSWVIKMFYFGFERVCFVNIRLELRFGVLVDCYIFGSFYGRFGCFV